MLAAVEVGGGECVGAPVTALLVTTSLYPGGIGKSTQCVLGMPATVFVFCCRASVSSELSLASKNHMGLQHLSNFLLAKKTKVK